MKKGNFLGVKGGTNIGATIIIFILVILLASFLPIMSSGNVEAAKATLLSRGYVVLAASEYSDLMTLLGSIDTKADLAVTAAQAAVVTAQTAADKVDLFNTADNFLFPADTDYWVLLTADAVAGSWSTWTEIEDNNSVTLSSLFAADAGYISDIYVYQVTAPADTTHIVEIAYGASKVSLTRIMFNSDNLHLAQIKSRRIPASETVYYRIMTNAAPTEYVSIGFRYFFE
jgi:hypothetical protein